MGRSLAPLISLALVATGFSTAPMAAPASSAPETFTLVATGDVLVHQDRVLHRRGGARGGHVRPQRVPLPSGREWSVDVADVPDVDGMLAAAARARAAGAEVVVASLHCCVEYQHDPTEEQVAAVTTLLASPDVDLVLGHHAHVVQPIEAIAGEWAAFGLGNHLAEHSTRGHETEDDGRFGVTRAEAVPLTIELGADAVTVRPADAETYARVAEVLDRRGGVAAGLSVVPH